MKPAMAGLAAVLVFSLYTQAVNKEKKNKTGKKRKKREREKYINNEKE